MTMNDHWGYNKNDKNFKSAEDLIWNLVDINAKGGNYLLNVGPTAEGLFPPESIERLNAIGEWMAVNSEAVHGAKTWAHWQEGENIRYAEGKNGAVYVFLRGKTAGELTLKKIRPDAGSAITLLGNDKDLSWRQTPDGAVIRLPEADTDRIRVLRMQGQPENVTPPPHIGTGTDGKRKAAVFAQTEEIEISAAPGAEIYYTTDGSEPNSGSKRYSGKFAITNSTTVRAIARAPGQRSSETVQMQYIKARYGIRVESAYAEKYAAQGPLSLVDGVEGSKRFTDGNWLGFEGVDFSAVLDLGAKKVAAHSEHVLFARHPLLDLSAAQTGGLGLRRRRALYPAGGRPDSSGKRRRTQWPAGIPAAPFRANPLPQAGGQKSGHLPVLAPRGRRKILGLCR